MKYYSAKFNSALWDKWMNLQVIILSEICLLQEYKQKTNKNHELAKHSKNNPSSLKSILREWERREKSYERDRTSTLKFQWVSDAMHVHKDVGHFTPGCQTNVKLLKLEKRNFREKHYQDKKSHRTLCF